VRRYPHERAAAPSLLPSLRDKADDDTKTFISPVAKAMAEYRGTGKGPRGEAVRPTAAKVRLLK
jgi:hypothetical protein